MDWDKHNLRSRKDVTPDLQLTPQSMLALEGTCLLAVPESVHRCRCINKRLDREGRETARNTRKRLSSFSGSFLQLCRSECHVRLRTTLSDSEEPALGLPKGSRSRINEMFRFDQHDCGRAMRHQHETGRPRGSRCGR